MKLLMALVIRLYCFFYILSLILAWPPPIYYENDNMGKQEKRKMKHLTQDLVKDSMLKLRQVLEIRQDHDFKVAYSVGIIIGRIREKYRFMLETYRDIQVSYHNYSVAVPPGVKYFRPFHFIIALEMVHSLEIEIDKLVDVLLYEVREDFEGDRGVAGESDKLKDMQLHELLKNFTSTRAPFSPRPNFLRGVERHKEEAEKSLMRQRYLMKKLGHPINMTTFKKRFLRHWPVEESWSLDKYNHDYK